MYTVMTAEWFSLMHIEMCYTVLQQLGYLDNFLLYLQSKGDGFNPVSVATGEGMVLYTYEYIPM